MSNYNLYHYCRRNLTKEAVNLLEKTTNIDILYEDGSFLTFAVSKENIEMFNALLKYFYEVQLPQQDNEYMRVAQKNKLKEYITEAFDMYSPSEKMEEIIKLYGITINEEDTNSIKDEEVDIISIQKELETKSSPEYDLSTRHHSPNSYDDYHVSYNNYGKIDPLEFNNLKSGLGITDIEDNTVNEIGANYNHVD